MLEFKKNKEAVIVYPRRYTEQPAAFEINAVKAFLENPDVTEEVDGYTLYPLGEPDDVGEAYRLVYKDGKWSGYSPCDTELDDLTFWTEATKEDLLEAFEEALK